MRIVAHDPYVTSKLAQTAVELVDLPALWAASDYISLHVPPRRNQGISRARRSPR